MSDLRERIAVIVESKLAFTNGWKIPDDDYTAKCSETADEIIALVRADYEQKVIEAVRLAGVQHENVAGCLYTEGRIKQTQLDIEAIKQVK